MVHPGKYGLFNNMFNNDPLCDDCASKPRSERQPQASKAKATKARPEPGGGTLDGAREMAAGFDYPVEVTVEDKHRDEGRRIRGGRESVYASATSRKIILYDKFMSAANWHNIMLHELGHVVWNNQPSRADYVVQFRDAVANDRAARLAFQERVHMDGMRDWKELHAELFAEWALGRLPGMDTFFRPSVPAWAKANRPDAGKQRSDRELAEQESRLMMFVQMTVPRKSRARKSVVAAKTQVRDGKVVHVRGYTDRRSKAVAKVTTPKGNVQYQYDAETLAAAKAEKFRRVAHLAKRLPEILEGMKADLAQGDTPQSKVAAAVVALIDRCCFRIGTDEYAEKHGTYGVTTLRPEHVTVDGATIRFQFTGKKQVPWDTATTDPDLADFIAHLASDAPADRLFWYHRDGRQYPIRANHVNDWLREYGVSANDFRTYHATRLCFEELKRLSSRQPLTKKEIKQRVKQAVAATAERLGHTPAVCRQSYILPAVIDDFEANGGRLSIDPWNMGKSFLLAFGGNAQ